MTRSEAPRPWELAADRRGEKDEAATSQISRAAFGKYRLQAVRAGWSWGSCGDTSLKVGLESTPKINKVAGLTTLEGPATEARANARAQLPPFPGSAIRVSQKYNVF